MNKNITKKDIVEGIGFILMVVGIIGLMGALYELKEIKGDIKEYKIQRIK
jgi:hypothetical protein